MSTRCAITFGTKYKGRLGLQLYKHSDGYPDGQRWLVKFAEDYANERGQDLEYCAAQCLIAAYKDREEASLDSACKALLGNGRTGPDYCGFGLQGLMPDEDPTDVQGDIEYIYRVTLDKGGRVDWQKAGTKTWTRMLPTEVKNA